MARALTGDLAELCERRAGVLTVAEAQRCLSVSAVRWQLTSGRWQRACHGVLVTRPGPLTEEQRLWVSLLATGDGAVLAGLTAARLDGLAGFEDQLTFVLIPEPRQVRKELPGVIVRRSQMLRPGRDVHPARLPPRTRIARSIVDAAAWAATDRGARAILAAGVQQRLTRAADLGSVIEQLPQVRRRGLMRRTLADVAGGAEALSELDFCELVRRFGLPEPDRQVLRADGYGRRYLDVVWERARLVIEIDGRWHIDAGTWWADMRRDNELTVDGYRVLRFPAFVVRDNPEVVAELIARALRRGGER